MGGVYISMSKRAEEFDKSGKYRRKVDDVLESLEQFRRKYPFKDHPELIDNLTAEDIFNEGEDCFFKWIVFELKDLGYIGGYPAIAFKNARDNLEVFKDLLKVVVDEEKTLAEKVDDARWEKIKRWKGDKQKAKKIIYCFNDDIIPILPIFKTTDLEDFCRLLEVRQNLPSNYDSMSTGEKYESLNEALLDEKEKCAETKHWDNVYFMWFLYATYKGY